MKSRLILCENYKRGTNLEAKRHKRTPIVSPAKPKAKAHYDHTGHQIDGIHNVIEHDRSLDSSEKNHHHKQSDDES